MEEFEGKITKEDLSMCDEEFTVGVENADSIESIDNADGIESVDNSDGIESVDNSENVENKTQDSITIYVNNERWYLYQQLSYILGISIPTFYNFCILYFLLFTNTAPQNSCTILCESESGSTCIRNSLNLGQSAFGS